MFVIFGWGFTTTHVFGAVLPVLCPNCDNEQFWILKRIRRWFTLFFVPVFPYESTHALMCPVCGVGRELHGSDLKRAKLYAETHTAFRSNSLDEEDYAARLAAIAEATDAQVAKGLAHVTAVQTQSHSAPERTGTVATAPPMPPAPKVTAPPLPEESDQDRGDDAFCAGCGRKFDTKPTCSVRAAGPEESGLSRVPCEESAAGASSSL